MFSNLANPAIGMNALFAGQAAPNLDESYGLHFDEAEISLISVVDPYWTFVSNIVFLGDGTVDPEEVWVRSTNIPGDPDATGSAILKVVDAKDPPLRIFFGSGGLPMTRAEYAGRIATWEKWNDVSVEAQGNLAAKQSR